MDIKISDYDRDVLTYLISEAAGSTSDRKPYNPEKSPVGTVTDIQFEASVNKLANAGIIEVSYYSSLIYVRVPARAHLFLDEYDDMVRRQSSAHTSSVSVTIENSQISGSAIGANYGVTLNDGASFAELKLLIDAAPRGDRAQLTEMRLMLERLAKSSESEIKKGVLAKFADKLMKNENLIIVVGRILVAIAATNIGSTP